MKRDAYAFDQSALAYIERVARFNRLRIDPCFARRRVPEPKAVCKKVNADTRFDAAIVHKPRKKYPRNSPNPRGRPKRPVIAPDGTRYDCMRDAARSIGRSCALISHYVRRGVGGWRLA